jgi:hypothetical protein
MKNFNKQIKKTDHQSEKEKLVRNRRNMHLTGCFGDVDPCFGDIDPPHRLRFKEHIYFPVTKEHDRLTILPFFS